MDDFSYDFLQKLSNGGGKQPLLITKAFSDEEKAIFDELRGKGLLAYADPIPGDYGCYQVYKSVRITHKGQIAMISEKQHRKVVQDNVTSQIQKAKADRMQAVIDKREERRHQYLIVLLTAAVTLIIEHLGGYLVELIKGAST